jgi:hypothetical protein
VALARPVARRAHDRLRAARGSVHDARHGRPGDADHLRAVVRFPAAVFARRHAPRVPLGPQWVRADLDVRRGRAAPQGPDQGWQSLVRQPRVDPGWELHRRLAHHRRAGERVRAVAVPQRRRLGHGDDQDGARHARRQSVPHAGVEHPRRGVRCRSPLRVDLAPPRRVRLRPELPAVAGRPLRPADRQGVRADRSVRERDAADSLARREMAGVRHPVRHRDGSAPAQSRHGRRAVAGLSRDPGRSRRRSLPPTAARSGASRSPRGGRHRFRSRPTWSSGSGPWSTS